MSNINYSNKPYYNTFNNKNFRFQKNNPRVNHNKIFKIQNASINEINEWFKNNNNNDADIKLISHNSNKFVISLLYNKNQHMIEITYPYDYPSTKIGFTVKEITDFSKNNFKFLNIVNKNFKGKSLSITKVLDYLATTFDNFKNIKKINKILKYLVEIIRKYFLILMILLMLIIGYHRINLIHMIMIIKIYPIIFQLIHLKNYMR